MLKNVKARLGFVARKHGIMLAVVLAIACRTCLNLINQLAGSAMDKPFQPDALMENT